MSSEKNYPVVDSAESFEALLEQVRQAQRVFAGYTQERVDAIFQAAAAAADRARVPPRPILGVAVWGARRGLGWLAS